VDTLSIAEYLINELWVLWAWDVPILFGSMFEYVQVYCCIVLIVDYKDLSMFASISMDVHVQSTRNHTIR